MLLVQEHKTVIIRQCGCGRVTIAWLYWYRNREWVLWYYCLAGHVLLQEQITGAFWYICLAILVHGQGLGIVVLLSGCIRTRTGMDVVVLVHEYCLAMLVR
jgi:hypothetical protein